jgi:hypothetical protein
MAPLAASESATSGCVFDDACAGSIVPSALGYASVAAAGGLQVVDSLQQAALTLLRMPLSGVAVLERLPR